MARPRLQWRWLVLSGALAIPWLFVWNSTMEASLLYVEGLAASLALAFGIFWAYRRLVDVMFFKRHDIGAAFGRVVVTSFWVVLAGFIFVQAAYSLKIEGSPGPQENQALWAGIFVISAAGIYRVLDGDNRPERPGDSV